MQFLSGNEEKEAKDYLNSAAQIAKSATCNRHKCGSLIVSNGSVIGAGMNSPPANNESQRRCSYQKDSYDKRVTDKTCCMHAEQRAIMDALKNNPKELSGSRIYFIRLAEDGRIAKSGKPYCTICSKMSLDAGITEFVLWHDEGICVYDTEEYNTLSYQYKDERQ
jgi:deoxycytidylate deaminase